MSDWVAKKNCLLTRTGLREERKRVWRVFWMRWMGLLPIRRERSSKQREGSCGGEA